MTTANELTTAAPAAAALRPHWVVVITLVASFGGDHTGGSDQR